MNSENQFYLVTIDPKTKEKIERKRILPTEMKIIKNTLEKLRHKETRDLRDDDYKNEFYHLLLDNIKEQEKEKKDRIFNEYVIIRGSECKFSHIGLNKELENDRKIKPNKKLNKFIIEDQLEMKKTKFMIEGKEMRGYKFNVYQTENKLHHLIETLSK